MRQISEALAGHLAGGVTTLCHGWRLTRQDGVVMGFTDHDRDFQMEGLVLKAASGMTGSENLSTQGLAVSGAELAGALSHDCLSPDDLAAGLYDGAEVELFLINWNAPAQHVLMRRGSIGEIRCADGAFTAEIRALSDALNQTRGRVFSATCDASLGDARCGVNIASPSFTREGQVSAIEGALHLRLEGFADYPSETFARGRLEFVGGANAGFATEIKAHERRGESASVRLWQRPPQMVAHGDRVRISAGCDKRFSTCRDRFYNALNFRGFPHMPGNDAIISVAVPGEGGYDGSLR